MSKNKSAKTLEGMSLEELWQLFPIFLVEPNPKWEAWYLLEAKEIEKDVPSGIISRISHIGSTAIPGIKAKNIVDILCEVSCEKDLITLKDICLSKGWLCMSQTPRRISLNKGYTVHGFSKKVFHLHLRIVGDNDELYFRDYLVGHPKIAKAYENLKLSLWKKYEHNRDGYTSAKTEFIKKYTALARKQYGKRYE